MEKTSSIIRGNLRQYVMIIALATVIILFQIITDGVLLMPLNIANIISQNSYIFILAVGMLLAILTNGNIDLSVGSVCGVVGAITAVMVVKMGLPVALGIGVGLGIGIIIGMWHGFWIAYAGVPAFIVTLAGMLIFRGFTMVILKGTSLAPMPEAYKFIASGFIFPDLKIAGLNLIAILAGIIASVLYVLSQMVSRNNKKKYGFDVKSYKVLIPQIVAMLLVINAFTYSLAKYKGIPAVLVLVLALVAIYTFITTKTIPGRHIYAYGGNTVAARLSGVNTKKVLFWVYVNMGLLSAVAGIVFTGRLNSATPKSGNGFELDAIAACFIGGASTTGGIGTVIGAIVGALLMGVLNNGMSIMGVSIDWQQTIKGFVLLAAVAFDVYSKSKTK